MTGKNVTTITDKRLAKSMNNFLKINNDSKIGFAGGGPTNDYNLKMVIIKEFRIEDKTVIVYLRDTYVEDPNNNNGKMQEVIAYLTKSALPYPEGELINDYDKGPTLIPNNEIMGIIQAIDGSPQDKGYIFVDYLL